MIDTIHAQLSAWGKWVVRSQSRSCGYPSVCPMFKDTRSGRGDGGSLPPIGAFSGADAMDGVAAAVSSLSLDRRILCAEYYVIGGRHCDVAWRMGIHPDTLHKRMQKMHEAVQNELCCESFAGKGEK